MNSTLYAIPLPVSQKGDRRNTSFIAAFLTVTKLLTVSLTLVAVLGWGGPAVAANDGDGTMAAIEVMREVQLEAASRPLKDLATKYREALEKKRAAAQESGNLESLVAVKAELELLAEGDDTAPPPKAAELAKLRQIYRDQKAKVRPQVEAALLAVDRDYAKELNKLVTELTKAGKADEALKVREKLDEFGKQHQAKREDAAAPVPPPTDGPRLPSGVAFLEGNWVLVSPEVRKPDARNNVSFDKNGNFHSGMYVWGNVAFTRKGNTVTFLPGKVFTITSRDLLEGIDKNGKLTRERMERVPKATAE
jgi:hypothetical protein